MISEVQKGAAYRRYVRLRKLLDYNASGGNPSKLGRKMICDRLARGIARLETEFSDFKSEYESHA